MSIDELITEEFLARMKEDYGKQASTVVRHAGNIIEKYPFVCKDKDKFETTLESVLSDLDALNFQIYDPSNHEFRTISEKNHEYMRQLYNKIAREVKDHFPDEYDQLLYEQQSYDLNPTYDIDDDWGLK